METSPIIRDDIVNEFNLKFQGKPGTPEREHFEKLKKPDICDIIISANEIRHHWYLDLDKQNNNTKDIDLINAEDEIKTRDEFIRQQQQKLIEKERILKYKDNILKQKDLDEENKIMKQFEEIELSQKIMEECENIYKEKSKKLLDYVEKFENIYQRKPLAEEINDNMKTEVEEDILLRFLLSYHPEENV
jgi:hypothetical protein